MEQQQENLKQKKIRLAQSVHAPVIVQLMKDCIEQIPLVADTQWGTIVNTIKFDAQSTMLKNMVNLLEAIKKENFIEK